MSEKMPAFDEWARRRYLHGQLLDVARVAWEAALATVPDRLHFDPVIDGLFRILPTPGAEWPEADRQRWLEMAETSIKRAYAEKAEPPLLKLSPQEPEPTALSSSEDPA